MLIRTGNLVVFLIYEPESRTHKLKSERPDLLKLPVSGKLFSFGKNCIQYEPFQVYYDFFTRSVFRFPYFFIKTVRKTPIIFPLEKFFFRTGNLLPQKLQKRHIVPV